MDSAGMPTSSANGMPALFGAHTFVDILRDDLRMSLSGIFASVTKPPGQREESHLYN